MSVLCLVEHDGTEPIDASLRALSLARNLAESSGEALEAALIGAAPASAVGTLAGFGVSLVHSVESEMLDAYAPVAWARALLELAASLAATAIVAAGTERGNEVMAHAGALSGQAMVANCLTAARSSETTVALSRQRWAGSLIEDALLTGSPVLLTVAFDGVAAVPATEVASPTVEVYRPVLGTDDLAVRVGEWARA